MVIQRWGEGVDSKGPTRWTIRSPQCGKGSFGEKGKGLFHLIRSKESLSRGGCKDGGGILTVRAALSRGSVGRKKRKSWGESPK